MMASPARPVAELSECWGQLSAECALASTYHKAAVLLGGDEVLIGRTVPARSAVNIPLAQVSSKHCRLLRLGAKEVQDNYPELVAAARGDPEVLGCVIDMSTNGSFLNGEKLEKGEPAALRANDLLCFASPDLSCPKCIAFRFQRYDPAGGFAAPAMKRSRPSGAADPSAAVDLHSVNQSLRAKASALAEQLAVAQARLSSDAVAAAGAVAALAQELEAAQSAASHRAEEAGAAAAAERARAETLVCEALASLEAEKARAAAASEAAGEAEGVAAQARAERDLLQARLREAEAALGEARGVLEAAQDKARTELRGEREATAKLREELGARDAALASSTAQKEAALRKAEHAGGATAALGAALAAEREKRAAAEAAAAAAAEQAGAAELRLSRLEEDTRGLREGAALESALQAQLLDFVRSTHAAAGAMLPHAAALQQARAAAARVRPSVPEASAAPSESERCTQRVVHSAPPQPQPQHETQHLGAPARESVEQEGAMEAEEEAEPAVLLPLIEEEGEGAHSDFENGVHSTFPSASLQAQMEAEAAAKRSSQPMVEVNGGGGFA